MNIIMEWYQAWEKYPYHNEVNFVIFIPLFFVLRSLLIRRLNKVVDDKLEGSELYSFFSFLINWGTFYAIVAYAVIYFKNTVWLSETLFHIGKTPVNALTIILPAVMISLALRFSKFLSNFVLRRVYARYEMDEGLQFTFNRLLHYVVVILSVLVTLPTVGFDLSALTVFAGVIGIGVGFGMQNIASNFISGLIILFERPIKVGDRVKVGDLQCDVEHISIRSTVVRTPNNEHIIIPNTEFIQNQVINWSYGDPTIGLDIMIGVAYGTDVRLVEKLLLQAADEHKDILSDPAPRVFFMNFGESSLDFRLFVWVANPTLRLRTKSDLNYRIYELLQEHDIEIPFPQRDLHLRSIDTAALQQFQVEIEPSQTPKKNTERALG